MVCKIDWRWYGWRTSLIFLNNPWFRGSIVVKVMYKRDWSESFHIALDVRCGCRTHFLTLNELVERLQRFVICLARPLISTNFASIPNVAWRSESVDSSDGNGINRSNGIHTGTNNVVLTMLTHAPQNKTKSTSIIAHQVQRQQSHRHELQRKTHSEREVCISQPSRKIMLAAFKRFRSFSVSPHPKSCPHSTSIRRDWALDWGLDSLERNASGRTQKWLSSQTQSLFDNQLVDQITSWWTSKRQSWCNVSRTLLCVENPSRLLCLARVLLLDKTYLKLLSLASACCKGIGLVVPSF